MLVAKSIIFFLFACIFEVGGGYLVWLWFKEDKPIWIGVVGGICLFIYGVIATLQVQGFGRVYATYGGFFIVFSLLWAYIFDGFKPDRYDVIGAIITLFGVCVIMYAPRHT
ncbi:YnfA family protein [Helicobacter sp. 11S03491-1]|uniref:YnfA family protein n=1 Tax=Helicobacter sp. 11S03491-1 TaxID=1476196 RepID=UPI000BA5977F|nr:YnfA family protein [Helicobacter sp. 11S03491-1]PAF43055.1 hypothetical protein BKH45_03035 [Helicobacter sp. 11S03491-1]